MPQPPAHSTLGIPFVELQSVDSTNNYLRQLVHENKGEPGLTVFAHEQVSGKGQRGKTWVSEKDANLILSVLMDPGPVPLSFQFHLSACISMAVYDLFSKYAGEETAIKWPNDLYWRNKKAGGVLIENIVGEREPGVRSRESGVGSRESGIGSWKWAIVGIGININQTSFPAGLLNPVSLKQITGKSFDPVLLAKELCEYLNNRFHQLILGDFETIHKDYVSRLYKKDQPVRLKKDNRIFEAVIKGVSPRGELIIQHATEEKIDFGTVEWL